MIPPRSILAAVDFSDCSRLALMFAARLAQQCQAALHVLHAEDPLLSAAARHHNIDLSNEVREELRAFVSTAPPASESHPHLHVVAGPSVDVICEAAVQQGADVIVVGSHGMSGPTRLVFGSTTERVLRGAERSVVVVPDQWVPPQPNRVDLGGTGPVLAAVDFSAESTAAAAAAHGLARALHTSVEAVHVVAARPVPARWQAYADAAVTERLDAARRELAAAMEALHADVPIRPRVETGSVPQTLADVTAPAPWRHPILVLGRRAPGARGAAPGAIAYRLLSLANVPILVHVTPPPPVVSPPVAFIRGWATAVPSPQIYRGPGSRGASGTFARLFHEILPASRDGFSLGRVFVGFAILNTHLVADAPAGKVEERRGGKQLSAVGERERLGAHEPLSAPGEPPVHGDRVTPHGMFPLHPWYLARTLGLPSSNDQFITVPAAPRTSM